MLNGSKRKQLKNLIQGRDYTNNSSGQGSKSTASCELPNNDRSSPLEYQLREKLGSMLDTYALSFTTDSFSWWQKPSANNNVIVIEEDSPAFEHTKSDLHKHTEIVNLDSPVSTDESALGSHASEACENEASDRNNSKQNTFEELASQVSYPQPTECPFKPRDKQQWRWS